MEVLEMVLPQIVPLPIRAVGELRLPESIQPQEKANPWKIPGENKFDCVGASKLAPSAEAVGPVVRL